MKRTPKGKAPLQGTRWNAILQNFTQEQLAGIGAVAMTFNDAERALQQLLGPCVHPTWHEVVASRVNGMEGIAAVIRTGARPLIQLGPEKAETAEAMQKDLGLSLDAFLEAKRFRDGVIHANIFDEETAIGHQRARDTLYEVLLHRDALQWFTNTCLTLSDELRAWRTVLVAGWRFTLLRGVGNQERSRLAEAVLGLVSS